MPVEQLHREFQHLERKIQLVLNENGKLRDEISQVRSENMQLKAKIENQAANINSFQNKMEVSKLANNMVVGNEDSGKLKEMLDGYIKEIDKCIAHLAE